MKKIILIFFMLLVSTMFVGCGSATNDVVRIHIRGNSNSVCDQAVKLQVRDSVVEYITPMLASCSCSDDVKKVLEENLLQIESIADNVLKGEGFCYTAKAKISYEYFPTREYDGEVFSADYYDALIVNLGSGSGDNWWCVAYPPLCFVGENDGSNNVQYKSKLLEIINEFFGR